MLQISSYRQIFRPAEGTQHLIPKSLQPSFHVKIPLQCRQLLLRRVSSSDVPEADVVITYRRAFPSPRISHLAPSSLFAPVCLAGDMMCCSQELNTARQGNSRFVDTLGDHDLLSIPGRRPWIPGTLFSFDCAKKSDGLLTKMWAGTHGCEI